MQLMDEAFLRQRRNVFVTSAILLVLCLGGVEIKELSLAGMKFEAFRKPEVFLLGIWVAFGYFVYRYLVYFLEVSPRQLSNTFVRELERAVNPRIEVLVHREYQEPNKSGLFSYAFLLRHGRIYKGQALLPMDSDSSKKELRNFDMPIPIFKTLLWEIWGVIRFALLTPALSEHLLPFAIALATVVYCGFIATWSGSFHALAA